MFNFVGKDLMEAKKCTQEPERPDHVIKLYVRDFDMSTSAQMKMIRELRQAQGLVLRLREDLPRNYFNNQYQFIVIRNIPPTEKLPKDLEMDGDPFSDYFVTIRCLSKSSNKRDDSSSAACSVSSLTSGPRHPEGTLKSGYVVLAFKILHEESATYLDKTWPEWTGVSGLLKSLTRVYPIRSVRCYKGVNVIPDIFKYIVLVEFVMNGETDDGYDDLYALDCMQKFRIQRMAGYGAIYVECNNDVLDRAMEDNDSLGAIMQNLGSV